MEQTIGAHQGQTVVKGSPKARILQVGNYPPPVCGWAVHTQAIQHALTAEGADCQVLDLGPSRRIGGRNCVTVRGGFDYVAKLVAFSARGFTFELHVNGDSWKRYLLVLIAALLGRLTQKPPVLMFHAGPSQMLFPRKSGFWFHAFRLLFLLCGEIICNMDSVKNEIVRYGIPSEKVHPIFSVQYQEGEFPAPLPDAIEDFLNAHEPRIFSYTLFRPEFTMECLFETFARVRKEFARAGLLILGPIEIPVAAQEDMERLGIDSDVLIAGNLPRAQFLTAISRSDVFIRTHLRDGLCSSVIEALKLGVPVVATDDGLRPPSVFKYAPADGNDLTRVTLKVLSDLNSARSQVRAPDLSGGLTDEVSLLLSAASHTK